VGGATDRSALAGLRGHRVGQGVAVVEPAAFDGPDDPRPARTGLGDRPERRDGNRTRETVVLPPRHLRRQRGRRGRRRHRHDDRAARRVPRRDESPARAAAGPRSAEVHGRPGHPVPRPHDRRTGHAHRPRWHPAVGYRGQQDPRGGPHPGSATAPSISSSIAEAERSVTGEAAIRQGPFSGRTVAVASHRHVSTTP
jgi:hypothetical protein